MGVHATDCVGSGRGCAWEAVGVAWPRTAGGRAAGGGAGGIQTSAALLLHDLESAHFHHAASSVCFRAAEMPDAYSSYLCFIVKHSSTTAPIANTYMIHDTIIGMQCTTPSLPHPTYIALLTG